MFRRRKVTHSPARDGLVAADAALTGARKRVRAAEESIGRLEAIIAAAPPARAAVQRAINADGAAGLSALAAGRDGGETALSVAAAEAATRAAGVASEALPAARRELEVAAAEMVRLDDQVKRDAIDAVLIAEAETIGAAYVRAFDRLMRLHDRLSGIDRALGGKIGLVAEAPIEMRRFDLRSMPAPPQPLLQGGHTAPGETFSPYLQHIPNHGEISRHALAWTAARVRLAKDPTAEIGDLTAAEAAVELEHGESPGPRLRPRAPEYGGPQVIPPGLTEVIIRPGVTGLIPAEPLRERPPMRYL